MPCSAVNGSKCGCCWSFATVGVVESINALATGQMDVLSEQQLIACDKKGECISCVHFLCPAKPHLSGVVVAGEEGGVGVVKGIVYCSCAKGGG